MEYIKKLEQDIENYKKDLAEAKSKVDYFRREAMLRNADSDLKGRVVLLVGGPCDGMRLTQEKPLSRISMTVEGYGTIAYGVQKVRGHGDEFYLASPDWIMDSMAYLISRYPQFVSGVYHD